MAAPKIMNVGIDFGSSISVISADNGVRACVPSFVGFPKDMIARKLLGKEYLVGDDAIKNRLSCNIFRPLERGVLKYSDHIEENESDYRQIVWVAQIIFNHLINLATQGRPQDFIIRACIGTPSLANDKNKQALLDLTESMMDCAQIVSEPFSVAYGMSLLSNTLIVDIGGGTVDLCRMQGVYPTQEDQLTVYKAGDYIDNVFFDLLDAKYPDANYTINMLRTFKEENATISDTDEKLVLTLPVCGRPTELDLTEELRQACSSIVPDIADAIKYLISTHDPEFQEELKGNIVLAGGGSKIIGLCEELEKYMTQSLGYGSVRRVPDPVYAGANGALMYCKDMPEDFWIELKESRVQKTAKK